MNNPNIEAMKEISIELETSIKVKFECPHCNIKDVTGIGYHGIDYVRKNGLNMKCEACKKRFKINFL